MHTDTLSDFIDAHPRLTVLSGAGCSTASGIPDYRDDDGNWKHAKPVQFADFVNSAATRQRYWARSFVGWTRVAKALPNDAHHALAKLEQAGHINCLVTQNVDNLHRAAGSDKVVDLHGVLDKVRCLDCNSITSRHALQAEIRRVNPDWQATASRFAPDGDAHLEQANVEELSIPACSKCGGIIKPDVVFFGEAVPRDRISAVSDSISQSDALLVVGSSLMVWSGFQFARKTIAAGKPLAIVNRGKTRADDIATFRLSGDCSTILQHAADRL
jgi:NAD-dependent SIR2 family protein deacetylase